MGKQTAAGTFDLDGWDQKPWSEVDGVGLGTVTAHKVFSGDAVGESEAQLVMVGRGEEGIAYGGLERFDGELNGRAGTFVLHHDACQAPESEGGGWFRWSIVPGSGTGGLAGIAGAGTISRSPEGAHSYTFEYDLPNAD